MPVKIFADHPLKDLTTLRVGGNAWFFVEAKSEAEIGEAIKFAAKKRLPIFVLGGGSNLLVSDEGFNGLVIWNRLTGIKEVGEMELAAGSGEKWDDLVGFSVSKGWAGLECLSGIPGNVGAAPVQNIGAYGEEVANVIKEIVAYDLKESRVTRLSKDDCQFAYRRSIFNDSEAGRYIILEVVFRFKKNSEAKLNYKDLEEYFAGKPKPGVAEIRKAVLEIRARKGMVIHPDYESYRSAGSFFKNPSVSKEVADKLISQIGETNSKWHWPQPDGKVRISAARLIEFAGFHKGFKMGEAAISPKHSLSLINLGDAKASDIISLARKIIDGVNDKFGIKLEPEVLFIGFDKNPL